MNIQLTNGDVLAIPEGCVARIDGSEIIIENKKQGFQNGCILCSLSGDDMCIVRKVEDDGRIRYHYCNGNMVLSIPPDQSYYFGSACEFRLATDSEKQILFDKMKEQGLRWNAEEKKVEKIRWRAETWSTYYYLNYDGDIITDIESGDEKNNLSWEVGNYFRTMNQAKKAAEMVKEVLMKFHEKNDIPYAMER